MHEQQPHGRRRRARQAGTLMEFTFLGTSAGTPTRSRNVTGLALRHGGPRHWYLVDCGEGTQHQLLRTSHTLHQLQAIFITHVHGDHSLGLPGLLASASMARRSEPLTLVAPAALRAFIETALHATDTTLNFPLRFVASDAEGFHWADDALEVATVALSHRVPCKAFVFTERNLERKLLVDKLVAQGIAAGPLWGDLQRGRDVMLEDGRALRSADYTTTTRLPRRLIVAGDNDTPELLRDACRGVHVLIHEATYTEEVSQRVGPAPMHSTAARVASFAASAGVPNLVLTHFSPRYQNPGGPGLAPIEDEARLHYDGKLFLARDFASFELTKDYQLLPQHGT